jgi:hypothetical protein
MIYTFRLKFRRLVRLPIHHLGLRENSVLPARPRFAVAQ